MYILFLFSSTATNLDKYFGALSFTLKFFNVRKCTTLWNALLSVYNISRA